MSDFFDQWDRWLERLGSNGRERPVDDQAEQHDAESSDGGSSVPRAVEKPYER